MEGPRGKGKVLGRSPNSSVTVIPTCPLEGPGGLLQGQGCPGYVSPALPPTKRPAV